MSQHTGEQASGQVGKRASRQAGELASKQAGRQADGELSRRAGGQAKMECKQMEDTRLGLSRLTGENLKVVWVEFSVRLFLIMGVIAQQVISNF